MRSADTVTTRIRRAGGMSATVATVSAAVRYPAAWTFAAIYALATVVLIVTGHAAILGFQSGIDMILAVLCVLTVALTAHREARDAEVSAASSRPRAHAYAQITLIAAYTLYVAVFINGGIGMPLTNDLNRAADGLPFFVRNPLLYCALPALVLLAAGVHRREMGLAPGRNAWPVAALWGVVPLYLIGAALLAGTVRPLAAATSLLDNALRNGFFEEFLWRGAVLGRIRAVAGTGWGVVLSSLGFGLWHLAADTSRLGGNPVAGLAYCVVCQATVGLGFAVAFVRTRNLVAPSVAHVLFNGI